MATQEPVHEPAKSRSASPITPEAQTPAPRPMQRTPRSRAGAAWVGICVAALVLIALIVFMMQNTAPVRVTFLSMQGSVPLAIALLIAGVGVGVVALVIGTVRIGQLRRRLSHERKS